MTRATTRLVAALAAAAALLALCGTAAAAQPTIRRGDSGAAVSAWQQRLNAWIRAERPGLGTIAVDGSFGASTYRATTALERATGLPVNGVVSDRTRAALYDALNPGSAYEWPVPLPQWYWDWAAWYTGTGDFAEAPLRSGKLRPSSAPRDIPDWAWRRLAAQQDKPLAQRARRFVIDRLQARYRAGDVDIRQLKTSSRDASWMLLTGIYGQPMHRIWAAWLHHGERYDRLQVHFMALDARAVQPDDAKVRNAIPCDLRPAWAEVSCARQ